ncbi:MAG: hypothetical protein H0V51_01600 [Chloroflexi bacterium]|nr:hypothetical protein [Chloroflexota bacterium]
MQKWEYLEVFIDYAAGEWHDSVGRDGELVGEAEALTPSPNTIRVHC